MYDSYVESYTSVILLHIGYFVTHLLFRYTSVITIFVSWRRETVTISVNHQQPHHHQHHHTRPPSAQPTANCHYRTTVIASPPPLSTTPWSPTLAPDLCWGLELPAAMAIMVSFLPSESHRHSDHDDRCRRRRRGPAPRQR